MDWRRMCIRNSIVIKKNKILFFFFQGQKSDWVAKIKDFYPLFFFLLIFFYSSYINKEIQNGYKGKGKRSVDWALCLRGIYYLFVLTFLEYFTS